MPFLTSKETYKKERKEQRRILKEYMETFTTISGHFLNGYSAIYGGNSGQGHSDYTNNGTISEYALSNWKWLTFKKIKDNLKYYITVYFQSPDIDIKSKNSHVLFDRLYFSFEIRDLDIRKDYRKIFTDIDLPLDETDMKKLLSIMDKEIGSIAREVKKQHVSEKC